MFNSTTKSKKTKNVTVQQQSGQVTSPQPIQEVSQSRPAAMVTPSHEEIAMRAYQIYVEKGRPQGQSEHIWQQAEKDIRNRARAVAVSK
jgi:hypothetical protein